jgi:pyruvate dehydrogenase E1 component
MSTEADHESMLPGGIPTQYVDNDPDETSEWLDSLDAVIENKGKARAHALMLSLLRRAGERQVGIPLVRSTDYINSISPEKEPDFPGNEVIEKKLRRVIRWNAAMLVHRAQRPGISVGGHISTYASSASLYEVGFNHFFRGKDHPGGGDQIFYQGHASPGMYARAFLEGRLTSEQLDGFRQELSQSPNGLSSYPHPRLMPNFWEFPTVSMGLGPLHSIYQARFNRYLHHRGIKDTSKQHVWAFLGDGEMDEPESTGAIRLAAREDLDNLTFVVNCNLQRLDGPVRGNGKIIQELESLFRGAGWNVIKVIWGREWDELLAQDTDGALVDLMNVTPDGDFQTYKAENGAYVKEHFFGRNPITKGMVQDWSDEKVWNLKRGGHDYRKLYAAYKAATEHKGQPTVILVKTIKGYTLGSHFEGRNATHQMKKLTHEDLLGFRDRLQLPIPDSAIDKYLPPYYVPDQDSEEMQYLHERRRALGGYLPERRGKSKALTQPPEASYEILKKGSGNQQVATTMAFVRLLKELLKVEGTGARFVPIVPDEARTFGMDSLFSTHKVYSPHGQQYVPVDREQFLSYKESTDGQVLEEGITEAGAVSSWLAAGTAYATHDEPMIPVYVFYSMFGFQRTGDQFWAAMDQMSRGFVLGATAGRTTLNGEGLQHEDGHSPLLASTNPAAVIYDPAFSFEIAHLVKDGLMRMYGEHPEDIFYYFTVYNEPISQPAEPENLDVAGLLKGIYKYAKTLDGSPAQISILASGISLPWALEAQQMLANDWKISADIYSVTSWSELRRDALEVDREKLLNPSKSIRAPYLTEKLKDVTNPIVAVSDFMRAVPDSIRQWLPNDFYSLGTDGWGLSDTRGALRRHFLVDAASITVQSLAALVVKGALEASVLQSAVDRYQLADPKAADAGNTEGSG